MQQKEIANSVLFLMIAVALFYDIIQFLVELIPVAGQIISFFITTFAFLTFWLWFKMYGKNFINPKRALPIGAGVIIEIFPILNILPGWTVAIIAIVGIEKAEAIAQKMLGGGGFANDMINITKNIGAKNKMIAGQTEPNSSNS